MAVSSRSSVFTFESSVHSCHVLHCLNEQRCRDVLCDVTVVAEGQSFRAHRSVLASCSEYFSQRISSLTDYNVVITLPPEVTAAGFEPLLKFAYTSKLPFGKENVLDIQTSASVLGFKDLDGACFDFLLPKFFSSTKATFVRKTCCKKKCKRLLKDRAYMDQDALLLDDKEVKPVADSPSQEEASLLCNKSVNIKTGSQSSVRPPTPVTEGGNDNVRQCPKYRKFQLACCKEACVAEKSQKHPVTVTKPDYDLPCPSQNETGNCFLKLGGQVEEMVNNGRGVLIDEKNKTEGTHDKKLPEIEIQQQQQDTEASRNVKESAMGQGNGSTVLHHCTQEDFCKKQGIIGSLGQQKSVINFGEDDKKTSELSTTKKGSMLKAKEQLQETDFMESTEQGEGSAQREGAKSEVCVQDSDAKCSSDAAKKESTSDWLNIHLNVSSSLFQDLDQSTSCWKGAGSSDFEGASQSGVSSLNSGEDSETEAEGYSEAYARERAKQVQLPYPVDQIIEMSRNDFQELLDKQVFTREQLDLVRDMRRRSKNRLAAQRCRKRKLDCIYNLQCEINKLKTEREKLIREKSQLSQIKSETCHSVSALCQRVCSEANLQPEQLQALAKYTSADCPLTSYVPSTVSLRSHQSKPITQTSSTGRPVEDLSCTNSQHPGTKT